MEKLNAIDIFIFLIVFTCILVSRLLPGHSAWPGYRKELESPWHLHLQAHLISPSHFCSLRMSWTLWRTIPVRQFSSYSMLFFEEAALPFWVFSDAPHLILDRTILLEQWFLEHQTSKKEKVKMHAGCRLVHNYKFLTGLDVAVMLTCVSLSGHDVQSQYCIHLSTKGSPEAPRHSLQGERKCPHASGLPSRDCLGWRWSLQATSLPSVSCFGMSLFLFAYCLRFLKVKPQPIFLPHRDKAV